MWGLTGNCWQWRLWFFLFKHCLSFNRDGHANGFVDPCERHFHANLRKNLDPLGVGFVVFGFGNNDLAIGHVLGGNIAKVHLYDGWNELIGDDSCHPIRHVLKLLLPDPGMDIAKRAASAIPNVGREGLAKQHDVACLVRFLHHLDLRE